MFSFSIGRIVPSTNLDAAETREVGSLAYIEGELTSK